MKSSWSEVISTGRSTVLIPFSKDSLGKLQMQACVLGVKLDVCHTIVHLWDCSLHSVCFQFLTLRANCHLACCLLTECRSIVDLIRHDVLYENDCILI